MHASSRPAVAAAGTAAGISHHCCCHPLLTPVLHQQQLLLLVLLCQYPPFACAGVEGMTTLRPGTCVKKASGLWLW